MTQDRNRYRAIETEVFARYADHRYAEGLALVRSAIPELPAWRADLSHLAACLLAVSGRPVEAFGELTAAFAAGAWWHRRILAEDDDLASLRELTGFAEFVERSHARVVKPNAERRPPVVRRPAGPPTGLLVALHGAGQDAAEAAVQWASAVDAGFVLMAVESSQLSTPTYRSWPDSAAGTRDIVAALAALAPEDRALPLIAAGFSAGGRQAIHWALDPGPDVPVGFIAMAPAIGPQHLDQDRVAAAVRRGLTGVLLLGDQDDDVRDDALAALDELQSAGFTGRVELIPGLGHDFPADFDDRLAMALVELVRLF